MPYLCSTPPLLQELPKGLGGIGGPVVCFDDLGDLQHGEGLHKVFLGISRLLPCMGDRSIYCPGESVHRYMDISEPAKEWDVSNNCLPHLTAIETPRIYSRT